MSRYADTSSSGITRRKAQVAIAAFYKPGNAATGSLDTTTLTQLRQGRQPIVEGPTGAVLSAGCCNGTENKDITVANNVPQCG